MLVYCNLIFEGEFINDKRWNGRGYDISNNAVYDLENGNGKTIEYENGEVLFEGEYINGEINGKGKEYYEDGKLKYEGEYLNGYRNGKGKEYSDDGH